MGKAEESQLLTFHAETLKTRSDLSLNDAARLYDEFIKLNKFVEDEEISVKLQKQFPGSEYYFTPNRFAKKLTSEQA